MEKVNINGKEIEFDIKDLKPLSEAELDAVAGGTIYEEHITIYRWICDDCWAYGPWCSKEDIHTPAAKNLQHQIGCRGFHTRMDISTLGI